MVSLVRAMLVGLAAVAVTAAAGCASGRGSDRGHERVDATTAAVPVRLASHAVPSVPARRTSTLLDFESPADLFFIAATPAHSVSIDAAAARDGVNSLLAPAQAREIVIKLPSLLEGREFPADWTLVGAYFHSDAPAYVTASYEVGGRAVASRTVGIAARTWMPVMIDLHGAGSAVGTLRFRFSPAAGGTIRCDDVVLIDNHDTVVEAKLDDGRAWSVKRRGLSYVVESAGRFGFEIVTAEAQQGGWWVAEAGSARARFQASATPSTLTVYADGRSYCDGEFKSLNPALRDAAELAEQHQAPAELSVPAGMGRVNRATPGDANNDGYNEASAAYQLAAAGPRLELTMSPRSPVVSRPVIEISNLPPGPVLITMEGQLVEISKRMSNGNVLVELPARIQRPTLVNVRVK